MKSDEATKDREPTAGDGPSRDQPPTGHGPADDPPTDDEPTAGGPTEDRPTDDGPSDDEEVGNATLNIFLVEDDRVDRMNVARALKRSHVTNPLYTATDGEQALRKLREGRIPLHRLLILLDLNMPRMNGIEFLQSLRADEELRHLPVVVLTTSDSERDRIEAYELNVAGYIVKPVTFQRFVEAMSTLNKYWTLVELP